MLSKAVLRPAKSGSGERISKTVKQRMAEYYHDMLWQNVGELVQQSVLWYDLPGFVHLPFALQHPRICLGLSNVINDNMYNQFGGLYKIFYQIIRSYLDVKKSLMMDFWQKLQIKCSSTHHIIADMD